MLVVAELLRVRERRVPDGMGWDCWQTKAEERVEEMRDAEMKWWSLYVPIDACT